ncbi:MAG: Crp/Fnr family transcriptional regulator [Endomicrobium sp.]|jgi:CRP-like cAMP-binding protein|nr:Crp/Fnr family transcriptional regulator [Endomicrobium sp.]
MHHHYEVLKRNHIFDDMTVDDLRSMGECFKPKTLYFHKGDLVFSEGEIFKNIAIVVTGIINIYKEDADGNRVIIEQAEPGAILDESITVKKDYKVNVCAEVSVDSEVIAVPFDKLVTVCKGRCPFHVKLLSNVVRLIASNHNTLTLKVDYLSKKSIRHKLLSFFKFQVEKYKNKEFDITFDRKELSEFLFVDRSALSRELGRMQRDKIIEFHKNHFKILKENAL